jgi:hypothetical protein
MYGFNLTVLELTMYLKVNGFVNLVERHQNNNLMRLVTTSSGRTAFLKNSLQRSTISLQKISSNMIFSTKKSSVVQTTKSHDLISDTKS